MANIKFNVAQILSKKHNNNCALFVVKEKIAVLKYIENAVSVDLAKKTVSSKCKWGKHRVIGIIDGPPPAPQQNLDQTGSDISGNVVYGKSFTSSSEHSVSSNVAIGIKTEGEPDAGVGPAWEMSLSAGVGSSSGTSKEESFNYSVTQNINTENNKIINMGTIYMSGITLKESQYKFYSPDGRHELKDAPIYSIVKPYDRVKVRSYNLFQPDMAGNLNAYTEEGWNKRMGTGYVEAIIKRHAMKFKGKNGEETDHLSFSWSVNSNYNEDYMVAEENFKESSWSFSASVYAGVGFDFFVSSGKALAGVEYNYEASAQTSDRKEWGINAEVDVPASLKPNSVLAYDWDLYFLKPDKLWVKELINRMPEKTSYDKDLKASLDPNSAPWKICYVVTQIIYNKPIEEVDSSYGMTLSSNQKQMLKNAGYSTVANVLLNLTDKQTLQLKNKKSHKPGRTRHKLGNLPIMGMPNPLSKPHFKVNKQNREVQNLVKQFKRKFSKKLKKR